MFKSLNAESAVFIFSLEPNPEPSELPCRNQRCSAPRKRVKHRISRVREEQDAPSYQHFGHLTWMSFLVGPGHKYRFLVCYTASIHKWNIIPIVQELPLPFGRVTTPPHHFIVCLRSCLCVGIELELTSFPIYQNRLVTHPEPPLAVRCTHISPHHLVDEYTTPVHHWEHLSQMFRYCHQAENPARLQQPKSFFNPAVTPLVIISPLVFVLPIFLSHVERRIGEDKIDALARKLRQAHRTIFLKEFQIVYVQYRFHQDCVPARIQTAPNNPHNARAKATLPASVDMVLVAVNVVVLCTLCEHCGCSSNNMAFESDEFILAISFLPDGF